MHALAPLHPYLVRKLLEPITTNYAARHLRLGIAGDLKDDCHCGLGVQGCHLPTCGATQAHLQAGMENINFTRQSNL